MSLIKTLAKVAIGVAVAKGVSSMANKGRTQSAGGGGGLLDALSGGGGAARPQGGGIEDMLGSVLGGGTQRSGGAGDGLGGLLEGLSDASTPRGGVSTAGAQGGLDSLLEGLAGKGGASGGDLGGLLGGLAGAAGASAGGNRTSNKADKGNSFGEKLNQSLKLGKEPDLPPTPQQELAAGLMLRAMIQAAKSDGKIDDAEREKLLGKLGDISPQERDFVNAELAARIDVDGLARQVPKGLEAQVYAMSIMGINLDNRTEAQYLHDFATALGIDKRGVNHIHAQLGVPSIYG